MPIDILMPALSPTMEEGKLAKWLKKEGDAVKSGDVIAEIETDKATMEFEAVDEGTLGKILIPEGTENVKVNTPIASLLGDGESAGDGAAAAKPAAARPAAAALQPAAAAPAAGRAGSRGAARGTGRRSRHSGRHRDGHHVGARGAARRHGRGDAPRPGRLRHGRGGRRISGRLQGHPGSPGGIRRQARGRYADHRIRLRRHRRRRGAGRPETDRRVHDVELRHAGDRPHRQLGGQDPLHVGRPDGLPGRLPGPERRRLARRRPAQPGLCRLVFGGAGPQGRPALFRRRCQGPAQGGDPRSQPGRLPRKRNPLRPHLRGAQARRLCDPARQGAHRAGRHRRHPGVVGRRHGLCAEGGERAGRHGASRPR